MKLQLRSHADRWRHAAAPHFEPARRARTIAILVVVLLPLSALGAIMVRGYDSASVPHLEAPAGASAATLPAPTTTSPSMAGISLAAVAGSTTVPPVRTVGTAKLSGTVSAPTGVVPGAIVHIERVDGLFATDVAADADGHYEFGGMAGGRLRVRAFLAPLYAQVDPAILFVRDGEDKKLDLTVAPFDAPAITAAIAPDPPIAGQPANLVVRVATQTVDADGVVRSAPVSGASVALTGGSVLSVQGPATLTTGAGGTATFSITCKSAGALSAAVFVKLTSADAGRSTPLTLPDCGAAPGPATTSTTAPGATTTSTVPNSSTTTTTSSTTTTTQP